MALRLRKDQRTGTLIDRLKLIEFERQKERRGWQREKTEESHTERSERDRPTEIQRETEGGREGERVRERKRKTQWYY